MHAASRKMSQVWRSIPCCIADLRLDITLACGQSFRWREIEPGVWRSVLSGCIWTLKQTDTHIFYQVHNPATHETSLRCDESGDSPTHSQSNETKIKKRSRDKKQANNCNTKTNQKNSKGTGKGPVKFTDGNNSKGVIDREESYRSILWGYFQLDVDLKKLYRQWAEADANFSKVSSSFPGVRILRQDPVENLVSFICSSNNNISRISGMVEKLCTHFGEEIAVLDGQPFHSFPSLSALSAESVEEILRKLGFGYRAKFISQTARMVTSDLGGEGWLWALRGAEYDHAHTELMRLPGVGAKVADCVCLMSLDKKGAIPVDTHVWQIASRDYMTSLQKTKSLTDRTYRQIGNFFRELFGDYAGWAHSVLFSADLKKFQEKSKVSTSPRSPEKKRAISEKPKGVGGKKKKVR